MKNHSSLPEGFVYPIGYHPTSPRILDNEILSRFKPFELPYIVTCCNGEPGVDPEAPVAITRLRNGRCPNLTSALRYFELGGSPDAAMEATYSCEDTLTTACDYSEGGFHQTAVEIIRSLPTPFQQSGTALQALVESLMALERYEEALDEVRLLIASRDVPTQWALTLQRLQEVKILLLLGHLETAEKIMNQRRKEFQDKYQYFGYRAALALARGDEPLARSLVVKAGRIDTGHGHKILWNPLLKPLEAFIRKELLTEEGRPLVYEQDVDMHRICNRIHGALLLGERDRAANLAEGLVLHRVTSWGTAEELMLAWAGLGLFEALYEAATILPGKSHSSFELTRQVAHSISKGAPSERVSVGVLADSCGCSDQIKGLLIQAAKVLAGGGSFSLPTDHEFLVVEVGGQWREDDRDLFYVHCAGERCVLTKMSEPRQRRPQELKTKDLREHYPIIEKSDFASSDAAAEWIEHRLKGNVSYIPNNAYRAPSEIYFNGWTLVAFLKPSERTPLLREAWATACNDPNFYFKNGPATSFGYHSPYPIRLLHMLALAKQCRK